MDLVASCAAFVAVSRYGSFTRGAAAAGIPQSVASRRIAALEQHFGAPVLERTSRTVLLTPFGRDMLPAATRLAELAETLQDDAERARAQEFDVAVPLTSTPQALARLIAAGRGHGLHVDVVPAEPSRRLDLLRTLQVRAAIAAVPAGEGGWEVPLGLAAGPGAPAPGYLDQLRVTRDDGAAPRTVWVQPEDVVPHVRDTLVRLGNAAGLQPGQIRTARTVPGAVSRALGGPDLLLCSRDEADEHGLSWRPVGEQPFRRGYALVAAVREEGVRLRTHLGAAIGACLGSVEP